MTELAKQSLEIAKKISETAKPPVEGSIPKTNQVLAFSLVSKTRGYIEKIVHQINGSYEHGWYDGCAVMIRRLIETLIIEVFESHGIAAKIQDVNGNYFHLKDLIKETLSERNAWQLGRNCKDALPRLKEIGDLSAHSRRYLAHRDDIDKIKNDVRIVVQELTFIAKLK